MSTPEPRIHIIGVGSDGLAGLTSRAREILLAADVVFGPEPVLRLLPELRAERRPLGSDLQEMVGNLTARRWKGQGWMSARSTDYPFDPANQALNLHFGGHQVDAWSNSFVTIFGFTGTAAGKTTTGQFALRNGPAPADYVVDILAFLGPDQ